MGKTKVFYIDSELNIKQGYTSANINLAKVNQVVIDYKNNKIKLSSELVADSKDKLNEQLNRMKVIKLAESYGLKSRWINNHLEIESQLDTWYVYENEYHKLVWVHRNRKGSKHDNHEHIQKVMYSNQEDDWKFIMRSIHEHDMHSIIKFEKNRMMHLFDMVKNNNIPKIKIC